jgi:hypothetical protein
MAVQKKRSKNLYWQIALGVVLILVLLSLVVPQVRASLSAWLGLSVAPSNEVTPVPATLVAVASSASEIDSAPTPAGTQFFLPAVSAGDQPDLSQVASQVGWDILTPSSLPEGYKFQSAYFDPNQKLLTLTYLANRLLSGSTDPTLTSSKTITLLESLKNDFAPMQVAPATNVEDILVNGLPAAFAKGAWDTQFVQDANAAGGGKMISKWRNDLAVKNVYWQDGNIYLVLVTDDDAVSQQDLIDMASSTNR